MTRTDKEALGWKWPSNSKKAHFFKGDGRSLCGKWMMITTAPGEFDNPDSPDNCAACRRKAPRSQASTVEGDNR